MTAQRLYVRGLDEMIEKMHALARPLGPEQVARFDALLARAYATTQDAVHVETGALKASGVAYSWTDGETWTGTIEYAGDPGIYELDRGGSSYFFDAIDGDEFGHALNEAARAAFGSADEGL